jgi:tRNA threonylcarbamoyl adenosine modification protein YeaZ
MYILAFDTTSSKDSCSIFSYDLENLVTITLESKIIKSEKILEMIDFAIKSVNIKLKDLDTIIVCKGPGSFLGTRIGLSTAKGLSKSLDIRCFGFNSLEIYEYAFKNRCYIKRGDKILALDDNNNLTEINDTDENWIDISSKELTKSNIMAKMFLLTGNRSENIEACY